MRKIHPTTLKTLAGSVSALALVIGTPAYAQSADDEEQPDGVTTNDPGADDDITDDSIGATGQANEDGLIVVTGSRVRRDTFNSISPLQVLTTEASRDVGEFDATAILQQSEAAAGQQIDATFQGFVLNNGPGSQTLNLRGLGADRTLLLVNGRRLAPAGVEGAPTNPSINLIPSSLVARYDLLLDGASSVYGSDAVAGVGNIILRSDLDGLELFASGNINEYGGGDDYTLSAAWGTTFDRGNFGIGVEYARRDEIKLGDRPYLNGCNRHYEVTDSGEIRTVDLYNEAVTLVDSGGAISFGTDECKIEATVRRIQPASTRFGFIYYDPAGGNTGIPGFSAGYDAFGDPVDRDGDGMIDVDYYEQTRNGNVFDSSFIAPEDRYNVMAYGEYELGGALNITPFFEANYSRADVTALGSPPQLFPWVPASNPFNPCNFATNPNGVDCRAADNSFNNYTNPANNLSTGFILPVRPIVSVQGDRRRVETTLEQYRGVLGFRGDLPFIGDSWTFEVSGVYSRSEGSSSRMGIRSDKLALALGIDPTAGGDSTGDGIAEGYNTGTTSPPLLAGGPCDVSSLANPDLAAPDLAAGCVPVNLFAQSLYTTALGDFATQAERDYLFGSRTFDTTYEQIVASAFVTGELFELPSGPVSLVLGGEYRKDSLDSQPDFVAANGLFVHYFVDQGAVGSKYLLEGFAELDVPLFDSEEWGEFDLNASGRFTEEEFYGSAWTYSVKAGWRPVPQVLVKASYGTSFRAPNLRENFLAGQSGFNSVTDPCAVPSAAYDAVNDVYDPTADTREQQVLNNCIREGRDPTRVGILPGISTINNPSVEITSGGSLALEPETSTSFTTGLSISESYGALDVSFNFNYYNIGIEGSIVEPTAQFVVNDCFLREDNTRSRFCEFVNYDTDPAGRLLISDVFAGFLNVNEETVRGIDLNTAFGYDIPMGNEVLSLGLDIRANHLIERSTLFINDLLEEDYDDDAGEFGFPSWTGRATFSAEYADFAFTWQTRWIGRVEQQADGIDPLSDAFGFGPDGEYTGFFGDTCLGGGSRDANGVPDGVVAGDGVYCRDIGYADDYFVHTASIRYNLNDFLTLRAGVTNVFNESPPLIDTNEVFGVSNTPIGNGYDLNGREYFGSVSVRF